MLESALVNELAESQAWLKREGFETTSFAYPYGVWNKDIARAAARYYEYARLGPVCKLEP